MNGDQTAQIQCWIDSLGAGDASAREALLTCAAERLIRLTHKMLKDYPGVHRWEETDDALQNATLRLCRALEAVKPPSVRDFFRLAAAQIRRELIDLARRYSGRMGLGANYASWAGSGDEMPVTDVEVADTTYDSGRLAEWTGFHAQVEALPEEEREVFDLLFYQGLPQPRLPRSWASRSGPSSGAGRRHGWRCSRRWAADCRGCKPILGSSTSRARFSPAAPVGLLVPRFAFHERFRRVVPGST